MSSQLNRGTSISTGLLAQAHRGVLYVDEVNLLDDNINNQLLNVLSEGRNQIEREGIVFNIPVSLCSLLPQPRRGALREHLLDRIAIALSADGQLGLDDERVQAVDQVIEYAASPQVFLNQYSEDIDRQDSDYSGAGMVEGCPDHS